MTAHVAVKILISQVNAACSLRPKVTACPPENPGRAGKRTALRNYRRLPAWLGSGRLTRQISVTLWARVRTRRKSCGLIRPVGRTTQNAQGRHEWVRTLYQHSLKGQPQDLVPQHATDTGMNTNTRTATSAGFEAHSPHCLTRRHGRAGLGWGRDPRNARWHKLQRFTRWFPGGRQPRTSRVSSTILWTMR